MQNAADFSFVLRNLLVNLMADTFFAGLVCAVCVPAIRKQRRGNKTENARRYTAILVVVCLMPLVTTVASFAPLLWRVF